MDVAFPHAAANQTPVRNRTALGHSQPTTAMGPDGIAYPPDMRSRN
jgi:hypothetical protein